MRDQLLEVDNTTENERLRVGLLVDSFSQPRWIESVIQSIQSSGIAEVVLIVKNNEPPADKKWRHQRYWQNRKHLLYVAYNKLDEFKAKVDPDAFETVDVEPLLQNVPVISVEPLTTKFTDRFIEEDVKKILDYKLDVALRFGFRILKGAVLETAKYGLWSYHHGDGAVNRGGPAGFWEVMEGEPVTGAMLQVLTEELDNGKIICRSWSPTSDKFSARLNRNHYYWKASSFVMRALERIYAGQSVTEENSYLPYSNRLYKTPSNLEMLRMGSNLAGKYFVNKARSLASFNQWSLAYRFRVGADDPNNTFYKFKYIIPPRDRFWADPFPVCVAGKYFVFIEEYVYRIGKGHISVIEVDRQGNYTAPVTVLETDYHLSYPCVFEWQDEFYMIPETRADRSVQLYRCSEFPGKWEVDTVLLDDLNATDATVMEHNGRWWMFANVGEKHYPSDWDELSIFHAETLRGPWLSHSQNPVKSDVRGSRPAGKIFEWRGSLYRPAQDSSKLYGYAMSINRITNLSTDDYLEKEVATILPRWDKRVIGTHTINSCHDLTVIDCLMKRSRF